MSQHDNPCPECGEKLSPRADNCEACGWKAKGARVRGQNNYPLHRMGCTWSSGQLQCHYPVGRFEHGSFSGWCIFHRSKGEGVEAARIAEESRNCPPEVYVERAKRLMYGDGTDNASVRSLRARLTHRATGGHVGLFANRVLGGEVSRETPEPGSAG